MNEYYLTIGLEMHCEGSLTNSKVFSSGKNEYSDLPNCNVSPVDMGFPGVLPVLNKQALKHAIIMSLILHARIPEYMYFERKNYYYPDLPKGYQITQNPPEECVGNGGYIDIEREDGSTFRVEIDNFHLEEDAAQLTHLYDTSTINYNRAGNPLYELVTKPCLHSADDAVRFLEHIRSIYQYCGISEADSKKGHLRCDVNVSVSKDPNKLGTKVEIKNVNSFSSVRETILAESQRQIDLINAGKEAEIIQETRRWDEGTGTTIGMRDKVDAEDYKYFVEPNIPPYKLEASWIEEIKASIPKLPYERKNSYINDLGLSPYDANIIIKEKAISDYYDECIKLGIEAKSAANWLTVNILGYLNKEFQKIEDFFITPTMLKTILDKQKEGVISSKQAKDIFAEALEKHIDPKELISSDNMQLNDEETIRTIVKDILANNEANVTAYKNGKTNLFQFFVGNVMKETKGKANPSLTAKIVEEELNK
ncbi:MAG: Asp-tRNA(Asn)/Glu-tRNA(Gln) amidotransferase subunit GatB [Bacilli bacterium]|nr:Asp-tRNA(Asn)/Glu-tRNA(Gln) amidotransferase subunit GatB [Bacilli bacterium]